VLDHAVIYVVPCLDADERERTLSEQIGQLASEPLRSVALDRNFPVDWNPLACADAGATPLCAPESRALAEFALQRPNIAATLTFRNGALRRAAPDASLSSLDREVLRRIAGDHLVDALDALDGAEGSWLRFAYVQLGAAVFSMDAKFNKHAQFALPQIVDLQRIGETAGTTALRLARCLPTLRAEITSVAAMGGGQWKLEVAIENSGRLSTALVQARERRACAAPRLELSSATLEVATLVEGSTPRRLACNGQFVELPEIPGGGRHVVRLFVSGTAEVSVAVNVSAPRAGRANDSATLR
jgi:hypothetical protein